MVAENKAYGNGTPYWKDYGSSKNTFTLRITIISTKEEIYQSDCKICTPTVSWMNFTYFAHGIQQPILKLRILNFPEFIFRQFIVCFDLVRLVLSTKVSDDLKLTKVQSNLALRNC